MYFSLTVKIKTLVNIDICLIKQTNISSGWKSKSIALIFRYFKNVYLRVMPCNYKNDLLILTTLLLSTLINSSQRLLRPI